MEARLASASQELSGTAAAQFGGSVDGAGTTGAKEDAGTGVPCAEVKAGATGVENSISGRDASCSGSAAPTGCGSATTGSVCFASLSSTPAAIAAAQASPLKGSGDSVGFASIVVTAATLVSNASTTPARSGEGDQGSEPLRFAGESPWKASSRQSGAGWLDFAARSSSSSKPPGRQPARGDAASSSSSSSGMSCDSSSQSLFLAISIIGFAEEKAETSSAWEEVSSRLPKATGC